MRDKKYVKKGTKEQRMRDDILKAWKRGERSFHEVVEITGYSINDVAKYLPMVGRF